MRRISRGVVLGLVATTLAGISLISSAADEPAAPKPAEAPAKPAATAVRKGYDPARRVPPHFAKVGLTQEQRELIYKARAEHLAQIDRLRRELQEQQAKMMAASEGVLTDVQRKLLDEHRRGASKAREKAAEAPAASVAK